MAIRYTIISLCTTFVFLFLLLRSKQVEITRSRSNRLMAALVREQDKQQEAPDDKQNSTKFSLMLSSSMGDASFEKTVIFEDGALRNKFKNCIAYTKGGDNTEYNEKLCFVEEVYTDRISFQYVYSKNGDYTIKEPLVKVRGGTAHPVVTGFTNENLSGSFTIMYRCQPGDDQVSVITMLFKYAKEETIEMEWGKKCGSGSYPYADVGYLLEEQFEAFPVGIGGNKLNGLMEVDPVIQTTHVAVQLKAPAEMQEFLAPAVSSNSEHVEVHLRGITTGGILLSDGLTKVSVIHNCRQNDEESALITFTMAIPPWNNLTAQWKKDCGGNDALGLYIGTGGPGTSQVMKSSKVAAQYNVTDTTSLVKATAANIHKVDKDENEVTFFVTNKGRATTIQIDSVTITASNPNILTTRFQVPRIRSLIGTGYLDGNHRTALSTGESKRLKLHFYCRARGQSLILVTLPIFMFKNVEFGFIKTCRKPMAYRHVGFLQTAGFLWDAIISIVVFGFCGFGVCYIKRKRMQAKRYEPLPEKVGDTSGEVVYK